MRFLYPAQYGDVKTPEPMYSEEVGYITSKGHQCVTFSFEDFEQGKFKKYNVLENDQKLIYRGWMLYSGDYARLSAEIDKWGARLKTTPEEYHATHHLPGWYGYLREFTATTFTIMGIDLPWQTEKEIEKYMRAVGLKGNKFFVKDFVKSLPKQFNSIATNAVEIIKIAEEIKKYRGKIQVGIAIREFENYKEGTERRYFVYDGKPYSSDDKIPEVVHEAAKRLTSPFFSVDVAEREDGVLRIIEVGDGGVSDLKEWSAKKFSEIFQ